MYAAEIYDQNARLVEKGMAPVNLKSVMIGELFSTKDKQRLYDHWMIRKWRNKLLPVSLSQSH